MNSIRLGVSESLLGCTLWRVHAGALPDPKSGRMVRFGLCPGCADLIGIYKGRFVAMEVKLVGEKPRADQVNFLRHVRKQGGIAGIVTSVQDALDLLLEE